MNKEEEFIKSLISGGIVGASLGALISDSRKNKKNTTDSEVSGMLAGAVLFATFDAYKRALETNLPVYILENGNIYEVDSRGKKEIVKKIRKDPKNIAQKFTLK